MNEFAPNIDDKINTEKTDIDECPETIKKRLSDLWENWEKIKDNKELVALFDRKNKLESGQDANEILKKNNYPKRTKISDIKFEKWNSNLNPKFIKNGFIYLLRGDYPDLDKKGFYSRTYGYGKLTTKQLIEHLHSPKEVGYALYNDDRYLTISKPHYDNKADELAYLQSARGGSSFVSTTTNIPTAIAGTGNMPDKTEQSQYEIYVMKIPIDSAINSNTNNFFGMNEDEVLVPDYISKDEIVAKFPREKTEEIYQYLHNIIGVTRDDLRI